HAVLQRASDGGARRRVDGGQQVLVAEGVEEAATKDVLAVLRGKKRAGLDVDRPGAEPAGLERQRQPFLALRQAFEVGPRLVLAAAVAQGILDAVDQRPGMERPLQKDDVAEGLVDMQQVGVALRADIATGEK